MQDKIGYAQSSTLHSRWTSTPDHSESAWNANASGSEGTWRLPTILELKVNYDKKGALTAANLPSSNVWSATQSSSGAWNVHFGNGGTNGNDKGSKFLVRCVRDQDK